MEIFIKTARAFLITVLFLVNFSAQAASEHPCQQIKQACESAGFVKGQAKDGIGLWVDCIGPIMRGTSQPKKATKPLPQVGADLVTACKTKKPNFGQGKNKG